MKKILYSFLTLLFLLSFQFSYAQEESAPVSQEQSEYQLPYPGLLPDSPLYPLKTLRDNVVGFLISEPLKKAEFNLLSADKRLAAAQALVNKDPEKEDLIYSTLKKGEEYFEGAVEQASLAKKQGVEVQNLLEKLYLSSKKHQETLIKLKEEVGSKRKEDFAKLEKRTVDFEKRVNSLRAK